MATFSTDTQIPWPALGALACRPTLPPLGNCWARHAPLWRVGSAAAVPFLADTLLYEEGADYAARRGAYNAFRTYRYQAQTGFRNTPKAAPPHKDAPVRARLFVAPMQASWRLLSAALVFWLSVGNVDAQFAQKLSKPLQRRYEQAYKAEQARNFDKAVILLRRLLQKAPRYAPRRMSA